MASITKKPLVSVIIPSYNHERYLGFAIESVINQTLKDWELIIIDDGSSDASVEIIKKYACVDDRIKYFIQDNHDAPYAINRGIKESCGEYISILNSDDAFEPRKLAESIEVLSQGADIVFAKIHVINEYNVVMDDKIERVKWINEKLNNSTEEASLKKLLLNINYIVTTTNFVFNRHVIEKIGYFHEKLHYGHDYNFLIRAYEHEMKIKFIPKYHSLYRIHSNNTISKGYAESLLEASYSIAKAFRGGSEISKKMKLSILEDIVILDIVSQCLSLSDEEMEDVVCNKDDINRKKIIFSINRRIKRSQKGNYIKSFLRKSVIYKILKRIRRCVVLAVKGN